MPILLALIALLSAQAVHAVQNQADPKICAKYLLEQSAEAFEDFPIEKYFANVPVHLDDDGNLIFSRNSKAYIAWRNRVGPHIPDTSFAARYLNEDDLKFWVARQTAISRDEIAEVVDEEPSQQISKDAPLPDLKTLNLYHFEEGLKVFSELQAKEPYLGIRYLLVQWNGQIKFYLYFAKFSAYDVDYTHESMARKALGYTQGKVAILSGGYFRDVILSRGNGGKPKIEYFLLKDGAYVDYEITQHLLDEDTLSEVWNGSRKLLLRALEAVKPLFGTEASIPSWHGKQIRISELGESR